MDYFVPKDEAHEKYVKLVNTTSRSIGGPEFHDKAAICESLIHVPKHFVADHAGQVKKDSRTPCMIYFHGGGGVAGTPA
jgi:acetyl esterase